MDAGRLTPYLRRRVLRLPAVDRAVLQRELAASLAPRQDPRIRLGHLAHVMQEVAGVNIFERNRTAPVVLARQVFVYVCRAEGYSQNAVGDYLDLDHSTICYLEKKMRDAFNLPAAYADAIALYNRFTSEIL